MKTTPDFLGSCRRLFSELQKSGFEQREETDRDGGQHFELFRRELRFSFHYYPPELLAAEIGPNAVGTMRDRQNLLEVLRSIGLEPDLPHGVKPKNERQYEILSKGIDLERAVNEWVSMLANAISSYLDALQSHTIRRLDQQGPWQA